MVLLDIRRNSPVGEIVMNGNSRMKRTIQSILSDTFRNSFAAREATFSGSPKSPLESLFARGSAEVDVVVLLDHQENVTGAGS